MSSFQTYMIRIILLLGVMNAWYFGAWFLGIPLTLWYLFHYPAYELCVVGALLDIQFYTGDYIPFYCMSAVVLVILFQMLVPRFVLRSRI